jgi:hypothetical protein
MRLGRHGLRQSLCDGVCRIDGFEALRRIVERVDCGSLATGREGGVTILEWYALSCASVGTGDPASHHVLESVCQLIPLDRMNGIRRMKPPPMWHEATLVAAGARRYSSGFTSRFLDIASPPSPHFSHSSCISRRFIGENHPAWSWVWGNAG